MYIISPNQSLCMKLCMELKFMYKFDMYPLFFFFFREFQFLFDVQSKLLLVVVDGLHDGAESGMKGSLRYFEEIWSRKEQMMRFH